MGDILAGRMEDGAHLGTAVTAVDHHLFDGLAELFGRAVVTGSEFTGGTVRVGFAPDLGGTIVEDVEVVGVVTFLLDDLELFPGPGWDPFGRWRRGVYLCSCNLRYISVTNFRRIL